MEGIGLDEENAIRCGNGVFAHGDKTYIFIILSILISCVSFSDCSGVFR